MSLPVASRIGREAVPLKEELESPIQWQGRQSWLKNRSLLSFINLLRFKR